MLVPSHGQLFESGRSSPEPLSDRDDGAEGPELRGLVRPADGSPERAVEGALEGADARGVAATAIERTEAVARTSASDRCPVLRRGAEHPTCSYLTVRASMTVPPPSVCVTARSDQLADNVAPRSTSRSAARPTARPTATHHDPTEA